MREGEKEGKKVGRKEGRDKSTILTSLELIFITIGRYLCPYLNIPIKISGMCVSTLAHMLID